MKGGVCVCVCIKERERRESARGGARNWMGKENKGKNKMMKRENRGERRKGKENRKLMMCIYEVSWFIIWNWGQKIIMAHLSIVDQK